MIRAGIIGGTGYTGVELLRLLVGHPEVELVAISSRSEKGKAVSDIFPSLRGRLDLSFCDPDEAALEHCDVVFAATPNGVAMTHAQSLLDSDSSSGRPLRRFPGKATSMRRGWGNWRLSMVPMKSCSRAAPPNRGLKRASSATLVTERPS